MKDKQTVVLESARPGMFLRTAAGYLMECVSINHETSTGLFKPHDENNGFGRDSEGLCPFGLFHEWELISEGRKS